MNTNARVLSFLVLFAAGISLTCAHAPVPPYIPSELCQSDASPGGAADPLLIEDAENGDDQIIIHDGRDGHLFTFVDARSQLVGGATVTGARPVPVVGGAHGSRCAWNLRGRLADERIVFAGLGVNLTNPKSAYDASRFVGISFFARHGAGSAWRIRVQFPDGNTDPDGGVCGGACFNDFGATIDLTEEWTKYTVLFDSLGQTGDWGTQPGRIDRSKLFGIQFRVKNVDEPFDIWIDDIAFVGG